MDEKTEVKTWQLVALPARADNYIWLWHNTQYAWVIDPTETDLVRDYIAARGLILADLLITHHHADHPDGIEALLPLMQGQVFGASNRIPAITSQVVRGGRLGLTHCTLSVQVLDLAGHTHDQVGYYVPELLGTGVVFCGDALFGAGCGRVFDGTMAQLQASVTRLMDLPPDTQIACAHEYTAHNLAFALAIQSGHIPTQQYDNRVKCARNQQRPSLPTTVALERAVNPFVRALALDGWDAAWAEDLQAMAHRLNCEDVPQWTGNRAQDVAHAFALCRRLRNQF